ncbi:MAG: hypothetical protein KF899_03670 [Parvibaculum sp.]|nr:hypothetical protein [Parvibaculum sp.]
MGRSYRLAIIALGLTLFAFQGHSQEAEEPTLESQPIAEEGQPESAPEGEEIATPEQQDSLPLVPAIQGVETAIRDLVAAQNQEEDPAHIQRQKDDLDAQERMALWAKWMFFAAVGSVFLTGLGVLLIWRTLYHTKRAVAQAAIASDAAMKAVAEARKSNRITVASAKESRRIGHTQTRAYVSVSECFIRFLPDGLPPNFNIDFKNTGQSPAYDLRGRMGWAYWNKDRLDEISLDHIGIKPWAGVIGSGGVLNRLIVPTSGEEWRTCEAAVNRGTHVVVVFGELTYEDISRKGRRTLKFRLFLPTLRRSPDLNEVDLFYCEQGNDGD